MKTLTTPTPPPFRLLLLLLAVLLLGRALPGQAQCTKLFWQDEFNGPNIDLSKWELETPTNQGTGQLDLPTARPENARIENGKLVLTIRKEEYQGFHYTSARLRTYKKLDFQYGRVEARVKGVDTQGNGFAFWMLGSDYETVAWPKCGEIDIFENTGRTPGRNIGTAHFAGPNGEDASSQGSVTLPNGQKWADDYHVAAIEWSPTAITWFMDDKPYHTLDLTNPLNGYRPFNRPFFLLLSVGMGGAYSGPPDATTVTPMSATIDWVHVYKGTFSTFVDGPAQVSQGALNQQYTVAGVDNGTYSWTVPAGARITAGQGTSTISVDWGQSGGDVQVSVGSPCGTNAYARTVTTTAPFVVDKVFENFETPPAFTYGTVSGSLTKGAPNPLKNSVNPSDKVGKYLRNANEPYDVIALKDVDASPAGDFVFGQRKVLLDVYTDAEPGTRVSLNFENGRVANGGNYPEGRYANFEAVTSKKNQWQTLEFAYTSTPDSYASAVEVNQWILLFAPVTNTGNVFYFDNLRTGQVGGPPRPLGGTTLLDFDGAAQLTKSFSNGPYTVLANPGKAAPNTSNTVAKYVRDASAEYDGLVYTTTAIPDARAFRQGTSQILMDVYSDAPVGTKLSLTFEASALTQGNDYPTGRYATFETVTTKQNQWETVTFSLSLVPDKNVSDAAVDKLVFAFNPKTFTTNTYYVDNIRISSTAPKESLVLADVWQDYDANDKLTLNYTTGAYSPKVANPKPGGTNTSANVAKYVRNATEQYDLLIFNKGTATISAAALKGRQQKLALDVYTDAPAGTPVLMGLDASSLLGTSETSGKHSNYQGVTTVQGAWHTVYFTYGSSPDPNVPDNLVDHVAILFELGQKTGTTYYFDNLRTVNVVQQPTLTTLALTPALSQNVAVGQKIQFAAQGKDQSGANIAAPGVAWQASGGGTIDASGLFTATTNGAFKVTATSGGLTSTADVLIGQGLRLTKLTVDPLATFINQGSTLRLTARGYDQTGQPVSFAPTWTASGATGVSVSGDGVLTAAAAASGTASVVASSGGVSATATITVRTPPAADSLVVTPAARKVEQGDALQFAAATFDQYGNPIASPASWSVSGGGSISGGGRFTSTTIGTFVVKAQAGAAVAVTYVSVVPKPLNLALRKPVRASSVQNDGLLPRYAVDGITGRTNPDTRWASQGPTIVDGQVIRDAPQWLRVDLGQKYDLTRVALYWENAYGKVYAIQVADDTLQARRTAYTEANGNGDVDDFALPAGTSGRYVWLHATGRGTPYGYSLYEMEVYGLPHQDPALTGIIVTPDFGKTAPGKPVAFKALGFDQFGNNAAIAPTWTASGGTISGAGSFSAPAAGDYTVTATAGGRSGAATITVKAGATPAPTPGSPNLALNKPIRASSVENGGTLARFANDGNGSTRWGSQWTDDQWLRVDLGATYNVNRVKITWESLNAYGKDYVVEIAPDTVNWRPLKTVTGNSALANDWTGLAGTGRYVRMKGVQRGTGYGYVIWELEVYGTTAPAARPAAVLATAPTSLAPALSVYPNPVAQTLTLTGLPADATTVAVYDVRGALVRRVLLDQSQSHAAATLDVAELRSGVYVIRVTGPTGGRTQRFVKQ